MIELPESVTLAKQLTQTIQGKKISKVIAGKSPHRFAFFFGDPQSYDALLSGKTAGETKAYGGHFEIVIEDCRLDFNDGVNLRYLPAGEKEPAKHQLYILFEDGGALVANVQMYGAMSAFRAGENDNPYYLAAREKVSPLSDEFDATYFQKLFAEADRKKTSAKAFLATEQRIPGVGNGVTQDILWTARVHPKKKLADFTGQEVAELYMSVKSVLADMTEKGGRDTEKDLFGNKGGYRTVMSKNNQEMICPTCGGAVVKEAYLGGNVYYCPACQTL